MTASVRRVDRKCRDDQRVRRLRGWRLSKARVRWRCRWCGPMATSPHQLTWWTCNDRRGGFAMARCVGCGRLTTYVLGRRTVARLRKIGAPRWAPHEVEPHGTGPVLTTFDLERFRRGLRDGRWSELR